MIHIGTWLWGNKYPKYYVTNLKAAVGRNFEGPYRFHVWKPPAEDVPLTKIQGCFARLRTFDPEWQARQGILPGERIVVLDLDLVVTAPIAPIFDRKDGFAILQGVNSSNPNPFNGSVWTLQAGYRPDVWKEFSIEAARAVPFHDFPDDQAWFFHKICYAGAIGPADGVYAFRKKGWPANSTDLPPGARIVAFPGHRDPHQFHWLKWVRKHWRE